MGAGDEGERRSMNGFWGADTEALRSVGSVYVRRAELLSDLETSLGSLIDAVEWTGEDAEAFRADWTGRVRPGMQDHYVELRHEARRLLQHADEQDAASAPDGPGGMSGPDGFLPIIADNLMKWLDLAADGPGGTTDEGLLDGLDGEFAELLRQVLSTSEGRAAFLGSLLGSLFGGLLAELIGRALELGMALQNLLTGLSAAAGLGALIGQAPLEGAAPEVADTQPASGAAGANSGEAASGEPGGGSGSGESAGPGGGGESSGGSGSGSGSGSGGGGEGSDSAGADAGAEPAADGSPKGTQGQVASETLSAGGFYGRIESSGDEAGGSLLERLLEMIGDLVSADGSGVASHASSIGHDIGQAGLDAPRS